MNKTLEEIVYEAECLYWDERWADHWSTTGKAYSSNAKTLTDYICDAIRKEMCCIDHEWRIDSLGHYYCIRCDQPRKEEE